MSLKNITMVYIRIGTAIRFICILRSAQPPSNNNCCTEIAEPTTIFDLLEFRWFRDWFRVSALSVGPFLIGFAKII